LLDRQLLGSPTDLQKNPIEGPITADRLGANMDDVCPFAATPPVDGEGQSIPTQGHRAGEI
jgi:hypothetical protein